MLGGVAHGYQNLLDVLVENAKIGVDKADNEPAVFRMIKNKSVGADAPRCARYARSCRALARRKQKQCKLNYEKLDLRSELQVPPIWK